MECTRRAALTWYAMLFGLILLVLAVVSVLPNPPHVDAQVIAWPQPPYSPANVSFATTTGTLVAAPTAGAVCVYGLSLTNAGATAVTVNIYLDGGTTSVGSTYLAASGGNAFWPLGTSPKNPYFITNLTTAFVVKTTSAVQMNGSVYAATCP